MKNQINNCRTCIFTRKKLQSHELIRLVFINNELVIDKKRSLGGRGFYISKNKEIIDKIISVNFFKKKFKVNVKKEFYDELINAI